MYANSGPTMCLIPTQSFANISKRFLKISIHVLGDLSLKWFISDYITATLYWPEFLSGRSNQLRRRRVPQKYYL